MSVLDMDLWKCHFTMINGITNLLHLSVYSVANRRLSHTVIYNLF